MDSQFTAIVQKLVTDQGRQALFTASRCRPLLTDYTKDQYTREIQLLLQGEAL
jgi:hypothetical protein